MNPDRLAELEEERSFLLRSIRDLDAELAAGDVDEHDFTALRDGYVARAASVLREIDDGRSSMLAGPARPWWRRAALIGGTLAVAVALGVFVAQSAGQRLPGQSLTGGDPADEIAIKLSEARQLIGVNSMAALSAYSDVVKLDPSNPEARTYTAWMLVQVGLEAQDQAQVLEGIDLLREASALDPAYADPHCFIAIASANFLDEPDLETVVAEGQLCADNDPPAQMGPAVQRMIDDAQAELDGAAG